VTGRESEDRRSGHQTANVEAEAECVKSGYDSGCMKLCFKSLAVFQMSGEGTSRQDKMDFRKNAVDPLGCPQEEMRSLCSGRFDYKRYDGTGGRNLQFFSDVFASGLPGLPSNSAVNGDGIPRISSKRHIPLQNGVGYTDVRSAASSMNALLRTPIRAFADMTDRGDTGTNPCNIAADTFEFHLLAQFGNIAGIRAGIPTVCHIREWLESEYGVAAFMLDAADRTVCVSTPF